MIVCPELRLDSDLVIEEWREELTDRDREVVAALEDVQRTEGQLRWGLKTVVQREEPQRQRVRQVSDEAAADQTYGLQHAAEERFFVADVEHAPGIDG